VLARLRSSNGVNGIIGGGFDSSTQILVVHFVAIRSFGGLASQFHQFLLDQTVLFDLIMRHPEGAKHDFFGHLLHFALHHHDVLIGGANNNVQVCLGNLGEGGVDDVLAVNPGHPDLGDRPGKGHIRYSKGSRGCQPGKGIGHDIPVCRNQIDGNKGLRVIISRE